MQRSRADVPRRAGQGSPEQGRPVQSSTVGHEPQARHAEHKEHWLRLPCAFYAASVAMRLSAMPEPARALVQGGGVALLGANLAAVPTILPEVGVADQRRIAFG